MLKDIAKAVARPLWSRVVSRLLQHTQAENARLYEQLRELSERVVLIESRNGVYLPMLDSPSVTADAPFMQSSTCEARDFTHPSYYAICKLLCGKPVWHRKQWEWVFVIHHLLKGGLLAPGMRGLGFGVGAEALPALFASFGASVLATDAPSDVGRSAGWHNNNEFSENLDILRAPWICPDDKFSDLVSFRPTDMTNIDADLKDFDFTWSSCCFEHLGSLEAGMKFVIDSVEKTLRIGGVACHTTEFNMSSNEETVEAGGTVIYRKRDIETLIARLHDRGHHVSPLVIGESFHHLDNHVDVAPYANEPHLKLKLAGFVTTSVGLTITRGR